jgi:hypothetical protein
VYEREALSHSHSKSGLLRSRVFVIKPLRQTPDAKPVSVSHTSRGTPGETALPSGRDRTAPL